VGRPAGRDRDLSGARPSGASGRRGPGPGPVLTRVGRLINNAVAHVPWLWPLLRRPVERFFDSAATGWDERVQPDSAEHLAPLAAAVEALARPPARVLEIGTGTGAGAFMLAQRFPQAELHAIDISREMIDRANAKASRMQLDRVRFSVSDVAEMETAQGTFDLVAMLNMPPFFDRVARLVAPGGYVACACSLGPRTPFYTSFRTLRRGFERRGLRTVGSGTAGLGTYYIAERMPADE
jgi:SAM-dependent methyltransferase